MQEPDWTQPIIPPAAVRAIQEEINLLIKHYGLQAVLLALSPLVAQRASTPRLSPSRRLTLEHLACKLHNSGNFLAGYVNEPEPPIR